MIKAINLEQKRAGEINYTSVKFSYEVRSLLLGSMENSDNLDPRGDIYSLSIRCNKKNEPYLRDCAK